MRAATLVIGAAMVVLAFAAATRVADTREGLIAEVVTLFAGLAGVGFLMYGLTARRRPTRQAVPVAPAEAQAPRPPRARRDLLLGSGGVALALFLLIGLELSGGPLWAALGLVILLPMLAGSVYLCVRFLRANP